jgi:hypothetical protein
MTQAGTGLQCRWCKKPARFEGNPILPEQERLAVHAGTGLEACEGGEHLAAPIDPTPLAPS